VQASLGDPIRILIAGALTSVTRFNASGAVRDAERTLDLPAAAHGSAKNFL
jgi:hypothetical protein